MATRAQNVGIKAIEVYFPSQVRFTMPTMIATSLFCGLPVRDTNSTRSASTKPNLRSSMASRKANTQLVSARPR